MGVHRMKLTDVLGYLDRDWLSSFVIVSYNNLCRIAVR